MIYPEAVVLGDTEYELNTGFQYALACYRCINDPDISDIVRCFGIIGILYKQTPPEEYSGEALRLAIKFLQCGKEASDDHEPDMDFEYDEQYINASFLSDYSIDLDNVDLHWWKFCTLLQGLTDNCILNRIRDLRNYDTSGIKDAKQRQRISKAKKSVALPTRLSADEKAVDDEFMELLNS